ncbi:MAG: M48 family metallopeptidase [Magnetococcales bacterium]|nr:M48 family metallopeptidase [Magnetococcales bacterium]
MKLQKSLVVPFMLATLLTACADVPMTGRQQLLIIPESQMKQASLAAYDELKKSEKVVSNTRDAEMVEGVGKRLQQAVEDYFVEHGMHNQIPKYQWEFSLFDNDEPNAFCMAGGKVGIYTGLLPITDNEAGLAAVMGHEIAHAVASHGRERASQKMATQLGGNLLQKFMGGSSDGEVTSLVMVAYGVGAQVGALLPFSRLHEAEADRMGLIFMAMAGYDPREAPLVWERMKEHDGGKEPPEFISTHPSNQSRIDELNQLMPEALTYYQK